MKKRSEKLLFFAAMVFFFAGSINITFAAQDAEDISLNGPWEFAYVPRHQDIEYTWKEVTKYPNVPKDSDFEISIDVPGYWDENLDEMKKTSWWSQARTNTRYKGPVKFPYEGPDGPAHPDTQFPYLVGAGWYRRTLDVPADWEGRTVTLTVGGVRNECYFYINGRFTGSHKDYFTPAQLDLTSQLLYGERNEIMLEITNTTFTGSSCAIRGYQGNSAGIYDDVKIHVSAGPGKINNLFLRPVVDMAKIRWSAELKPSEGISNKPSKLRWRIKNLQDQLVKDGTVDVMSLDAGELYRKVWDIPADDIKRWSTWEPKMYKTEIIWEDSEGAVLDRLEQSFGFRSITTDNDKVYLNGRPIMLRGICEIYSFSPDIHPENSVEYFRKIICRLKAVGYNHIRYHTWVPQDKYMQAADELGMLLQVELPARQPRTQYDLDLWRKIILRSRKHPSVAIYCGGNEEICHEEMVAFFENLNAISKELDPGSLFMPMETMRGIEASSYINLKVPEHIKDPNQFHTRLFERVTNCSDIFAPHNGILSYMNLQGQGWRKREPHLETYERPILSHELGIVGGYLDLTLEDRYNSTIPKDLYIAARNNLENHGRLHMAKKYYENSSLWQGAAHKYIFEKGRKSEALDGYDHLGGWDSHWHRAGYSCGLLNDFLELKHGATTEKILQYNGESVVLLDNERDFVFSSGEEFAKPVMVSLYGGQALKNSLMQWRLTDDTGVIKKGKIKNLNALDGRVTELGEIAFKWPDLKKASKVTLSVSIEGYCYPLTNQWDLWVFPKNPVPNITATADEDSLKLLSQRYKNIKSIKQNPDGKNRVVSKLSKDDIDLLTQGKDIILLGSDPFPWLKTMYQIATAGRVANVNFATVINQHPIFENIPHDGFCDWQFSNLLNRGKCTVFNELPIEFDPILEVVSAYKQVLLQAAIWELRVANGGRLFVAGCNFNNLQDPATSALLDGIFKYTTSDFFEPRITVTKDQLETLLGDQESDDMDIPNPDIGYDPQVDKTNKKETKDK